MMTYTAPDGHVMQSLPYPEEVKYTSFCQEISDGIYYSIETTGAATEIGIQQIKIKRVVESNVMNLTIIMSSDKELIEYQNNNKLI
jgi:hypothetical protein